MTPTGHDGARAGRRRRSRRGPAARAPARPAVEPTRPACRPAFPRAADAGQPRLGSARTGRPTRTTSTSAARASRSASSLVLRGAHRRRHDDPRAGDPRRPTPPSPTPSPTSATRSSPRRWRPWCTSCRPPLEPPTGRLLGVAHIQRLLREPPSTLVGGVARHRHRPAAPRGHPRGRAPRHLATYNLVAAPVVDEDGRLLGAVTVDDLLDHLLPENWRDRTTGGAGADRAAARPAAMAEQEGRRKPAATRRGAPRGPRLDTPREPRRSSCAARSVDADAFGVFAEQFARFMGTARFLIYMTLFVVVWLGWNALAPERPALRRLPVHLPDPDAQPAGVVRRAADPARAEPAGGRATG